MDYRMNLTQRTVPPKDPYLLDAHPLLSGNKKNFDIKTEAIYPAVLKNLTGRNPLETFETALGITDAGKG
jgi:hypothetical protein